MLILVVYFAVSSSRGLNAYFTHDDGGNMLNMHKYWSHSMADVVGAAVRVVTGSYRPLGGVYYFTLYKLAGFNPAPFRAVCLALMLANLLLAFALLRDLSGSLMAGMFGAVLITHHPAVLDLLYSSGTIYEILCFFFYFLTIRCYFVWRQAAHAAGQTTLSWRRLAVILVLTGCALDSKEMAMTLPGALLLIELIYFPPIPWSWRSAGDFVFRQCRGPLVAAALVAPTMAVKVLTRNPLSDDPVYASHSLRAAVEGMRAYHQFLLYGQLYRVGLSTLGMVALWTAMGLAAFALRSRPMQFGLCFLVLALLPVCLIARRGGYMLYIPLMGWALYAGSLFQRLCDIPIRRLGLVRFGNGLRFAALMGAAALIVDWHAARLAPYAALFESHQSDMRRVVERLRKVHPQLPRSSSLLLVDDPVPAGFELLFLVQLAYGDPTLKLDRLKMLRAAPAGPELLRYDLVLAGGWDLHDVRGVSGARPPVEVRFQPPAVAPMGSYSVEIPEFAGRTVDLATRTIAGNRSAGTITERHFTLDRSGRAALVAPPDSPPVRIEVRWVRAQGEDWLSAAGALNLER
ncbi:MAG: hypothetical protein WBL61_18130 [Bryobacteraceae bacterium]